MDNWDRREKEWTNLSNPELTRTDILSIISLIRKVHPEHPNPRWLKVKSGTSFGRFIFAHSLSCKCGFTYIRPWWKIW